MARVIKCLYEPRLPLLNDVLCVISPEHYHLLSKDGIKTKKEFQQRLFKKCNQVMTPEIPFIISNLLAPRLAKKPIFQSIGKCIPAIRLGLLASAVALYLRRSPDNVTMPLSVAALLAAITPIGTYVKLLSYTLRGINSFLGLFGSPLVLTPKVEKPESLRVVVAGGSAGKFSAFFPGFGLGKDGPIAHMTRAVTKLVMEEPNEGSKASRKEALLGTDSKDPSTSILNPKFEATESKETAMAKREGKLGGKVAFLDISKTNGDVLLDRIEEKLQKAYPEIEVIRFKKPTFSRPCPQSIRKEIVDSGATHVVAALAD